MDWLEKTVEMKLRAGLDADASALFVTFRDTLAGAEKAACIGANPWLGSAPRQRGPFVYRLG
ncbi:hypothetical protein, partial [Tropicimonas marinistellae]|uniref:hypothetical protein n=1 Tax=Tropicimonas marinistellae TaxID=1739787 RepID=UPI001F31A24D